MKTVQDIVVEYLKSSGLDGLGGVECSCLLPDLAPCGDIQGSCEPGRKVPCNQDCSIGGCDFHIEPGPAESAEDQDDG